MTAGDVANHFTDVTEDRSGRFEEMAGAVFAFQREANPVYSRYCDEVLGSESSASAIDIARIPFLPVDAFKHAPITTFDPSEADVVFMSSATGRGGRSRHFVRDITIYERAVSAGFEHAFGPDPWRLIAHLPEYASDSSLVYMARHLIRDVGASGSGFVLDDLELLYAAIRSSREDGCRILLFGAAFGLVDLAAGGVELPSSSIVLETGGMKTHRREMSRIDLHELLSQGFGVPREQVRSEYGMCELMSQCYTRGGEIFTPPPFMRTYVVDPSDPGRKMPHGRSGVLAVVDLANLYSCSFLLTGDRAVQHSSGFEILGRLTDAELRGCNFLLENA